MIKRLIKVVFFIPMLIISICYLPIAIIIWIITGNFPNAPLQNLIEL